MRIYTSPSSLCLLHHLAVSDECLLKLAKENFKDVDEHFLRVSVYGYIYNEMLGLDLDTKNDGCEMYNKAKAQYNTYIFESK